MLLFYRNGLRVFLVALPQARIFGVRRISYLCVMKHMNFTFIEYSKDSYLKEFVSLLRSGKRKFLIRGITDLSIIFALEVQPLKEHYNFSLSGFDKNKDADIPRNIIEPLQENPLAVFSDKEDEFDAVLIFVYSGLSHVLEECRSYSGEVHIIAPIVREYTRNKKIFHISIPKSGTHVLFKLFRQFGIESNFLNGHYPLPVNVEASYMKDERMIQFLDSDGVFLYRDPRDVVLSYYHYIMKGEGRIFPSVYYYLKSLPNFEEQFRCLILGNPQYPGAPFPSIRDYFLNFSCWLHYENLVNVRFEDLIGSRGGGETQTQIDTIWNLQLRFRISGDPARFAAELFDTDSPTFRKGRIGSYKEEFKKSHHEAFASLDQDFMKIYGYSDK